MLFLMAALLLPACARVRELARRSKCGKLANQLGTAQNLYATDRNQRGLPEAFVRGTEPFCLPKGAAAVENAAGASDASRAYVYFVAAGLLATLQPLSCPSDPLVAVLDAPAKNLAGVEFDLPTEGKPVAARWASPGSPALLETGHTYASYSMQAGNTLRPADLSPFMNFRIPLAAERNPWCAVFPELLQQKPTDHSREGNPWNHNREGATITFADGHNTFLADAAALVIPLKPEARPPGFDYLYGDSAATALPVRPPKDGACVRLGTAGGSTLFNAWMID
jgi:hypothetical protein